MRYSNRCPTHFVLISCKIPGDPGEPVAAEAFTTHLPACTQRPGLDNRFQHLLGDRVTFELRYQFPDETLVSFSELRFLPREAIEERVRAAGLRVEACYGDWDRSPFDAAVSKEMIFVVSPAMG
jgi:hypothetical protein